MGQSPSNAASEAADAAAAAADAAAAQATVYTYAWKYSNLAGKFLYQATNINWWAHGDGILPPNCICSYKKPSYVGMTAVGSLSLSEIDDAVLLTLKLLSPSKIVRKLWALVKNHKNSKKIL